MLGDVWRWAGKFRASERNLGIPFYEIPVALRELLDDAKAWIAVPDPTPPTRSRCASITGWCRFTRSRTATAGTPGLMADPSGDAARRERFSWGRANLRDPGEMRGRYIAALQAADRHDHAPLGAIRAILNVA